jgi:NRPS condensation-like uncharacterized protein
MRLWMPNINVVMATRIRGHVDLNELQAAIRKARLKHPLLGARVRIDGDDQGSFTTREVPDNQLKVISMGEDEDGWLGVVKQELRHRWEIGRGPLARFTLIHGTGESDLIVNAHHVVCDARSLAYLIGDILGFMVSPDQLIQPVSPISLADAIPESSSGSLVERLVMKYLNKKWLSKGLRFDENDYRRMHENFWNGREPKILAWALDEAQTKTLAARCKEEGVSVNSAIYTAFLSAQSQVQDTSAGMYGNVMVPVDFRNYLTQEIGSALGLYASAVKLRFNYDPTKTFWDSARELDRNIKDQLTVENIFASQRTSALHPSVMDGVVYAMFGDLDDGMAQKLASRMQKEGRTGILVSNLGRLDIPIQYGQLELEWIKPPAVYAGIAEKALEVLTIGNRMHFTLTYGLMKIDDSTMENLKEAAMGLLVKGK